MPELTSNEIDLLMDRDPLELSKQDIDQIIAYQRKARANFEAGIKPTKPKPDKPEVKAKLAGILAKLKPEKAPEQVIKRRF